MHPDHAYVWVVLSDVIMVRHHEVNLPMVLAADDRGHVEAIFAEKKKYWSGWNLK